MNANLIILIGNFYFLKLVVHLYLKLFFFGADLETYSCLTDAQARCHKRFSNDDCDDDVLKRHSTASVDSGDFPFRRLFQSRSLPRGLPSDGSAFNAFEHVAAAVPHPSTTTTQPPPTYRHIPSTGNFIIKL